MKSFILSALFLLGILAGHFCNAQYGQNNARLNPNINSNVTVDRYNPAAETVFLADTTINHVDFGRQKANEPFTVVFHFKFIDIEKPYFTFTKSKITGTNMSRHSGIKKIELTTQGFQVTYMNKEAGLVDDYMVVHTEDGDLVFRLTGEIIPKKKRAKDNTTQEEVKYLRTGPNK